MQRAIILSLYFSRHPRSAKEPGHRQHKEIPCCSFLWLFEHSGNKQTARSSAELRNGAAFRFIFFAHWKLCGGSCVCVGGAHERLRSAALGHAWCSLALRARSQRGSSLSGIAVLAIYLHDQNLPLCITQREGPRSKTCDHSTMKSHSPDRNRYASAMAIFQCWRCRDFPNFKAMGILLCT